jgi:hypothetical protein
MLFVLASAGLLLDGMRISVLLAAICFLMRAFATARWRDFWVGGRPWFLESCEFCSSTLEGTKYEVALAPLVLPVASPPPAQHVCSCVYVSLASVLRGQLLCWRESTRTTSRAQHL